MAASLPRLDGRVVVVTGANSGVGFEASARLVGQGATVMLAVRDPGRGAQALERIRHRRPQGRVELVSLDLASFASIRAAATELLDRFERIDVLVNNAGAILTDRQTTTEGFEMTFGVNHLGHFLLTTLLLDRIRASAPARIVNVSSIAHRFAGGMQFGDLQFEHRRYRSVAVYNESKLANVLFTTELAARLAGTGVTANSCHPGPVRSGFGRDTDTRGFERFVSTLSRPFLIGPARGADPLVVAAASPELEGVSGAYLARWPSAWLPGPVRVRRPARAGRDLEAARRLWEESERLVAAAPS